MRVRYKSPALGLLWALVVPLVTSLVLAFVFGHLVRIPVGDVPYALFLIVGLLPWNCVQSTIVAATTSIQDNGALVRKTSFPRQLIPASIVLANLINFGCALLVVCGIVWACRVPRYASLWLLPVAFILQTLFTLGMTLLVSAWQAQYRDTKYVVEMLMTLWFYLTPIIYPASGLDALGAWTSYTLLLNPMTGVVSVYRAALLGWSASGAPADVPLSLVLSWTAAMTCGVVLYGWHVFRRSAPTMADLVQG